MFFKYKRFLKRQKYLVFRAPDYIQQEMKAMAMESGRLSLEITRSRFWYINKPGSFYTSVKAVVVTTKCRRVDLHQGIWFYFPDLSIQICIHVVLKDFSSCKISNEKEENFIARQLL